MNARRTLIAATTALAAAALPGTAVAHDRGYYGPRHGYGYGYGYGNPGHGYGRYQPWRHGYSGYPRPVIVPPPFYAVPYPSYAPVPIYAPPPPPVYYPPVRGGFTFIWNGGW
jgi:hypothetical protein